MTQTRLRHRSRAREAFATISVLVMLTFLTMMVAVVMLENGGARRHLRMRQHNAEALSLAESGAQEALHTLAAAPAVRGLGQGKFTLTWSSLPTSPGVYALTSVGTARSADPASERRTVRVRVEVLQSPGGALTARASDWRFE